MRVDAEIPGRDRRVFIVISGLDVGIIQISLDTENVTRDLIVVAGMDAADEPAETFGAVRIKRLGSGCSAACDSRRGRGAGRFLAEEAGLIVMLVTRGVAPVDTDIEAGPVEGRALSRRSRPRGDGQSPQSNRVFHGPPTSDHQIMVDNSMIRILWFRREPVNLCATDLIGRRSRSGSGAECRSPPYKARHGRAISGVLPSLLPPRTRP